MTCSCHISAALPAFCQRASWARWFVGILAIGAAFDSCTRGEDRGLSANWHFFQRETLTQEYFAEGGAVGDFNRDGAPDVTHGPYWWEGPEFRIRHVIYTPQPQPRDGYADNFFAWARDFDGDGWEDLLVVGLPGTPAFVFQNPGAGKLDQPWTRHQVFSAVGNEAPHFSQLVGDDRPELVCSHEGHYGYVVPNWEHPWTTWEFFAISPQAAPDPFGHGLGVGDLNGDGRQDVLCAEGWFEHPQEADKDPRSSSGRWPWHPQAFTDSYGGAEMLADDVDGDGDMDVITSLAAHDFGLAWYEQTSSQGELAFTPHKIMGSTPAENKYGVVFSELHSVQLADIDGDGLKDIVTGKTYGSHHQKSPQWDAGAVVYWFRRVSTPEGVDWIPYRLDDDAGIGRQIVVRDVNRDGQLDVLVGGMKGGHLLLQRRATIDAEELRRRQPQVYAATPVSPPAKNPEATGFRPTDDGGRALNLDFEAGTLDDWTVEGEAFVGQPIAGDTVSARRGDMRSQHEGSHWIGGYEKVGDPATGTLTSADFAVTHRYGSFLLGGGAGPDTRVEVLEYPSGAVAHRLTGANTENMRRVVVDLEKLLGSRIQIRLVDASRNGWGHVNFDAFRFHDDPPPLPSDAAANQPKLDSYPNTGLAPAEAVARIKLPPGFHVTLCATEPDVRQPIAMAIDDRGRLWVAEAYEYPQRAKGDAGRDRILIFDDRDGDGKFDERKVFAEGLNLISGLEVGFGGVWVGAAPYLMFIPDANRDDVPDAAPQVLLDGWGYEDTHETLNAFIWGPDGWLYGCHGVFTHSRVGKPGTPDDARIPLNAAIWRYHPTRHEFEVFAHGTSNPWGVDFNDVGDAFCTACVIPHLFHIIPGARYQRQAGAHFNPYTYLEIKTIADHPHYVGKDPWAAIGKSGDLGGGHAHAGAMIYLGGKWPAEYRNQIFMNNIHGQRVNMDMLRPEGSGYVGGHGPDFLLTGDLSSQIINLRYGPDGQAFVIDWYDMQACHTGEVEKHDRSNGRIYKVRYGEAQVATTDLRTRTDTQLAEFALDNNDWYVRHARRILQERHAKGGVDPFAIRRLVEIATTHADPTRRLRGMWGLHVLGGITSELIDSFLADADPHVRGWAVRFAGEYAAKSPEMWARYLPVFASLARQDVSPVVRLNLASVAQQIPLKERRKVLDGLVTHGEDASDHNLPCMIWYAAEPMAADDAEQALAWGLVAGEKFPELRESMIRRIGSIDTPAALESIVRALGNAADARLKSVFLDSLRMALQGRRRVTPPPSWDRVAAALRSDADEELRLQALGLGVTFGDKDAIVALRVLAEDAAAPLARRMKAVDALLAANDPAVVPLLLALIREPALRNRALLGLAQFEDPRTPEALIDGYAAFDAAGKRGVLATLCARLSFARALLTAIEQQRIPQIDLTADLVRQLRNHKDSDLDASLAQVWGQVRDVAEDKRQWITRYRELVGDPSQPPADATLGRAIFARTCQQCHTLFGSGAKIGPDLTGSNRSDLEYLLSNVVDPSGVMAKEYQQSVIVTAGGQVLTGIVKEENAHAVTIQTVDAIVIVPRDEIEEQVASDKSMMPDDQLLPMSAHEIRSLLAYLASPQQTPLLATPSYSPPIFNGVDLTGWSGNPSHWSVDHGEIVARCAELERNSFLVSDLAAEDFDLTLEMKLVNDAGNSGIQFRSEVLEDGDLRGYQADVGPGWWGKLYEEHGREVLASTKDESMVRRGDWNTYRIRAQGSRIQTWINGEPCVDLDDPQGARRGIFALQLHSGGATEVRFRNLQLELLQPPTQGVSVSGVRRD